MIGSIHIVPRGDTWCVLREGDDADITSFPTHSDALEVARGIAQEEQTELVFHDNSGAVSGFDYYGKTPRGRREE